MKSFFVDEQGKLDYKKCWPGVRAYTLNHFAAYFGQEAVLQSVLEESPTDQNNKMSTPLMLAVHGRQLPCIAALLEANADINAYMM